MNFRTVVLNCQKCHEFLQEVKSCQVHKSLGFLFKDDYLNVSDFVFLLVISSLPWSNVSKVISLYDREMVGEMVGR